MAWQGERTPTLDAFHAQIPLRITQRQQDLWQRLWTDLHDELYWLAQAGPRQELVIDPYTPWLDNVLPVVEDEIRGTVRTYFNGVQDLFRDDVRNAAAFGYFGELARDEFLYLVPWRQIHLWLAHGYQRSTLSGAIRQYLEAMTQELATDYWRLRSADPASGFDILGRRRWGS